jgi:hypothetical protein
MAKDLDELLSALKVAPVHASGESSLDGLEAGVWAKVEERRGQAMGGSSLRTQLAVAALALVMGAVVGGVAGDRKPVRSEMVVLSEDAGLAPSVAIEGGA